MHAQGQEAQMNATTAEIVNAADEQVAYALFELLEYMQPYTKPGVLERGNVDEVERIITSRIEKIELLFYKYYLVIPKEMEKTYIVAAEHIDSIEKSIQERINRARGVARKGTQWI
jgi:hypothetical protein